MCILIYLILIICSLSSALRAEENSTLLPHILDAFYPPTQNSNGLWLSADLLCLVPQEDSIVLTNKKTDIFTTANVTEKPTIDADFKWSFGYRIGFGYIFTERTWDMALHWIHFQSNLNQERSTHGDIGLGMFPIWSLSDDILAFDWVSKAKMHWNLDVDLLDLTFGRSFSWKDLFFLRPFTGLRASWIDQKLKVRYGGGIFANGLNLPQIDSTFGYDRINMKNDFWGIGPQVGIEAQCNLGKGWRIFTATSGTLNYGSFDVEQKETYLKTVRYYRHCTPHRFRWILDAAAGFLWKTFLCKQHFALTFALGWEYHLFFNQVEWRKDAFDLVSDNNSLSLNGVALSGRFDF